MENNIISGIQNAKHNQCKFPSSTTQIALSPGVQLDSGHHWPVISRDA